LSSDINEENRTLDLLGKAGKVIFVTLNKGAIKLIRDTFFAPILVTGFDFEL